MDHLSDTLSSAWRALSGNNLTKGWITIPIFSSQSCRILAGRHFPGNEEAILLGFGTTGNIKTELLPEGNGFAVRRIELDINMDHQIWFALLRQPHGSIDIFTMMANDIVNILGSAVDLAEGNLFRLFLSRILAWQAFMQHGTDGVLSREAEIGLHGELLMLASLLDAGIPAAVALEAWTGPMDGLHDFQIGLGGIEVKTTIVASGFPAMIASLEQLDTSLVCPLFLAGIRLRLDQVGLNLPSRIGIIKELLQDNSADIRSFEARLIHAGFTFAMSDRYTRCFSHGSTKIWKIDDAFPHLTHANVNKAIRKARYELDLEILDNLEISFNQTLHELGVVCYGT